MTTRKPSAKDLGNEDERTIGVVPAAPGWFLLDVIEADGEHPAEILHNPIVAWRVIEGYGSAWSCPIGADDHETDGTAGDCILELAAY